MFFPDRDRMLASVAPVWASYMPQEDTKDADT